MNKAYVLDRTERELDRLDLQGIIYRDATRRALTDCGIATGMRVLDIGCGSGDVTRLAAELVGPSGSVLGIDMDAESVQSARARAAQLGVGNVAFEEGEAGSFAEPGTFDALTARFFLMHQPSPAQTLAEAARALRPGGVIMMLESHMAGLLDSPTLLSAFGNLRRGRTLEMSRRRGCRRGHRSRPRSLPDIPGRDTACPRPSYGSSCRGRSGQPYLSLHGGECSEYASHGRFPRYSWFQRREGGAARGESTKQRRVE